MPAALVSLLSEQVVAATLFCKAVGQSGDHLYVITTNRMQAENKLHSFLTSLNACGLQFNVHKIILQTEEDLGLVTLELGAICWDEYSEILVDITLGTKIMSIGVYSFFSTYQRTHTTTIKLYYQPRGGNQLVDVCNHDEMKIALGTISLHNYLQAYGVRLRSQERNLVNTCQNTKSLFSDAVKNPCKSAKVTRLFQELRNARHPVLHGDRTIAVDTESLKDIILGDGARWGDRYGESDVELMQEICQNVGFPPEALTKKHIAYLSGGWFEEWIYIKTIEIVPQLGKEQIGLGVIIETGEQVTNELDVALVGTHNSFVCIECKTSLDAGPQHGDILNETIYKQAALRKNFGLNAVSVLATLNTIPPNTPKAKRAADFGIKILDLPVLCDETNFRNAITIIANR